MTEQAHEHPGGLWAVYKGRFYALVFDDQNKHTDHVTWFYEIGLPDYGPLFDQILRGRMIWDWQMGWYVLSFYGTEPIPNHVYEQVTRTFNSSGMRVVEQPITTPPR